MSCIYTGDTHQGVVAAGKNVVEYMDLHLGAMQQCLKLKGRMMKVWDEGICGKFTDINNKEEWVTHNDGFREGIVVGEAMVGFVVVFAVTAYLGASLQGSKVSMANVGEM